MQFAVDQEQQLHHSDCLILGVYENTQLSTSAHNFDQQSGGYISRILMRGDLATDIGSTLLLYEIPNVSADRILLVRFGHANKLTDQSFRKICNKTIATLLQHNVAHAACYFSEIELPNRDNIWKVQQAIELFAANVYQFDELKSVKSPQKALQKVTFKIAGNDNLTKMQEAVRYGEALASGMNWVKNMGNLPGNICTPTYLAEQAKTLAQAHNNIQSTILDEQEMANLGMNALLSVSRGSRQPAKLIVLEYQGTNADKNPVVFVGKGVTFDSGGISIKPSPFMDEMKYDMCGGATVLGIIKTAAQLHLPLNIVGIIPATENLPGGEATKPGDIVKTMSGQTVEILNTDAEGRLILCDALTYAEKFKPELVIDIATLTGGAIMTFGHIVSVLFGNDPTLNHAIINAGNDSADRVWLLPMLDEYNEMLNSNFADLSNIASHNDAKTIIAACFLARFTKSFKWAHIDIAGVAWNGGKDKGATGRPMPLLLQFLWNKCYS